MHLTNWGTMLRTDLIDVLNSRRAWAFLGSGTSVGAGLPTWAGLLRRVVDGLDVEPRGNVEGDIRYKAGLKNENYPQCFGRVEEIIGRDDLDQRIKANIGSPVRESKLLHRLVDLPFEGYITTNYDNLIENYLATDKRGGWVNVGNIGRDLQKLSGNVEKVVWHMHGDASLASDRSKLVVTDKDYDWAYLEDSDLVKQLKILLGSRRLVVAGFGLKDVEVMRVLRRLGRLANPSQPILALMPDIPGLDHSHERLDLLENYNVDVIPYRDPDGTHTKLLDLVETYSSFVLTRSLTFGKPERPCPSYDPETTGLLLYNELALRSTEATSEEVVSMLLRAALLVSLEAHPGASAYQMLEAVSAQASGVAQSSRLAIDAVVSALAALSADALVEPDSAGQDGFRLTGDGRALLNRQLASAELRASQFSSSLTTRAKGFGLDDDSTARIGRTCESFIKDCIERRAMGVAMVGSGSPAPERDYHLVALLQALPTFLAQLKSEDEATALVAVVTQLLASPSAEEASYIGSALQAKFAVHLLGQDHDAVVARLDELRKTLFLIDSSVLIHILARSGSANVAATELLNQLLPSAAVVATTERLVEEVAEHVRWARKKVDAASGRVNIRTLEAATGRAGQWPNGFLEGFLAEASGDQGLPDFSRYLRDVIGPIAEDREYRSSDISDSLVALGVEVWSFGSWEGFDQLLFVERDEDQLKIQKLRERRGNFKHQRQVCAEAEALILIKEARSGRLTVKGVPVSNAVFISHTRILDQVNRTGGSPITMRPTSAMQWLATLRPLEDSELSALTAAVLWELDERGLTVVEPSQLALVFGPLISASRSELPDALAKHRLLVGDRFGESSGSAFDEVHDLAAPVVLQSYHAQRAAHLQDELDRARLARDEEQKVKLSRNERTELEVLRSQKKERRRKAQKNQKRSESSPKANRKRK